ncbi:MAG: YceH family protein [Gallionella sp.]|nr:YceH family protein [Gallionella sp.]MDD4946625.1 YceH family protein [Gallionella sp.]
MDTLPTFTPLEARVLGVLIEKEKTVPDSYPLSANTLMLGCNQKTARDPVMAVSESEVIAAIEGLKAHSLIVESSGGRVMRYAHNARRALKLPEQSVALLAMLMLRGPQTAGELRLNCDRLHPFGYISSVEAFLDELATAATPWVVKLPKAPGSREHRWTHLLCGAVDMDAFEVAPSSGSRRVDSDEVAELKAEVARLHEELAALREAVGRIQNELGLS